MFLAFLLHDEVGFVELLGTSYKSDTFGQLIEKLLGLADCFPLAASLLCERIARIAVPHRLGTLIAEVSIFEG